VDSGQERRRQVDENRKFRRAEMAVENDRGAES
jgi:hypothetical protein